MQNHYEIFQESEKKTQSVTNLFHTEVFEKGPRQIVDLFDLLFDRCSSIVHRFWRQLGPQNRSNIDQNRHHHIIKHKTTTLEQQRVFTQFLKPRPLQDEWEIDQQSIKN